MSFIYSFSKKKVENNDLSIFQFQFILRIFFKIYCMVHTFNV